MDWDAMFGGSGGHSRRRKRKYNRYWTREKMQEAIAELRANGMDFLTQKYGNDRVSQIRSSLDKVFRGGSPGRSGGGGYKVNIPGLGVRKIGNSKKNAPPKPLKKDSLTPGPRVGFKDGGPPASVPPVSGQLPNGNAFPPGTFKPRMQLNLENESELAQGSHHPWAQPTSISSTITGLLRQAQNASGNYWSQWAQGRPGQTAIDARASSPFGTDVRYTGTPAAGGEIGLTIGEDGVVRYLGEGGAEQLSQSNPMGAFGTSTAMGGHDPNGIPPWLNPKHNPPPPAGPPGPTTPPSTTPPSNTKPPTTTPPSTTPPSTTKPPLKDIPDERDNRKDIIPPMSDILGPKPPGEYNPWHRLEGGEMNRYGPTPQYMGQATMQALSLANAYFAPQRMELAYELGDMETDMRRLAVNLGRQVDDPVLQAKLYKEAMRATRTLDVQQNTFAFQMAEQRRREELQNYQYYDQLAQEEAKIKIQNRQFFEDLDLKNSYFNLNRSNVINNSLPQPQATPPGPTSPTTTTTGGGFQQPTNASIIQNQFNIPGTRGASLSGIYGNILRMGNRP